MDDLNKQKLDALFQEGSERYDFTYREDAWDSMDAMLDQQEEKRKKRFFGLWIILGVAALVGAFGIKNYISNQQNQESTEKAQQEFADTKKITATESVVINESTETSTLQVNDESKELSSLITENTNSNTITDLPEITRIENGLTNKNYPKNKPVTATTVKSFSKTEITSVIKPEAEEVSFSNPKDFVGTQKKGTQSTVLQPAKTVQVNPTLLPTANFSLLEKPSFELVSIQVPPILLVDESEKEDLEKEKKENRFLVGLSIGPEFSFIGGTSQAKAGYYLGLDII